MTDVQSRTCCSWIKALLVVRTISLWQCFRSLLFPWPAHIYSAVMQLLWKKWKFKQNWEWRWGEKADGAYSSALSWICRKQEAGEKRADDEARCGSMLPLLAGKTRRGSRGGLYCLSRLHVCHVCLCVCTVLLKQHTCEEDWGQICRDDAC